MSDEIFVPPGYRHHFPSVQIRQARDQALKKAREEYEAVRAQIFHDYNTMMENNGYLPVRKDDK